MSATITILNTRAEIKLRHLQLSLPIALKVWVSVYLALAFCVVAILNFVYVMLEAFQDQDRSQLRFLSQSN